MMQRLLPYGLQQYLPDEISKLMIELCSFFKPIYSATLMEDDILKAQSKRLLKAGLFAPWWMFPFKRFMKKIKGEAFKDDQYILATQVKQCFYLEDMARRQPHWKVVEHVNHKKFSDEGVIVVEEDPDVIHFDNSSDLPLSTSLNDLDNATLHIDGQLIEVDAPPNIINLDEDDDIIDDEDALPHDLADSDDEDLVNVDDDDGVDMLYGAMAVMVAVMIVLLHTIYPPVTRVASLIEAKAPENPIWVARKRQAAHPLGDPESRGDAFVLPLLAKGPGGAEGDDRDKIRTQFDLKPHLQSERWTDINAGIQQHLQKFYNTNKASLKAAHWVINPETGTYDVESIRQRRPENITPADWDAQIAFWNDPRNQARAAQNRQNQAKSTVMKSSTTQEYPSLIHTFFVTHTVGGVFMRDKDRAIYEEMLRLQALGSNTPSGVPYTEEAINALDQKGKHRGHLLSVGRVLPRRATDVLSPPPPQRTHNSADILNQYESSPEFSNASGSGGCGDDEDGGEDEEDEEDGDSLRCYTWSLGKVARESIPDELSPSMYPGRHVVRDYYPQRQVARERVELSLGKVELPSSFCYSLSLSVKMSVHGYTNDEYGAVDNNVTLISRLDGKNKIDFINGHVEGQILMKFLTDNGIRNAYAIIFSEESHTIVASSSSLSHASAFVTNVPNMVDTVDFSNGNNENDAHSNDNIFNKEDELVATLEENQNISKSNLEQNRSSSSQVVQNLRRPLIGALSFHRFFEEFALASCTSQVS
nr:hypothetical protein [Tanacetum cinerariifolium]